VIRSEGENMTQMEIDKLWYKLDRENRGKIDLDRFSEVMHHPNSMY
jgi:Ca2+-binding EF-hand superfamily protein